MVRTPINFWRGWVPIALLPLPFSAFAACILCSYYGAGRAVHIKSHMYRVQHLQSVEACTTYYVAGCCQGRARRNNGTLTTYALRILCVTCNTVGNVATQLSSPKRATCVATSDKRLVVLSNVFLADFNFFPTRFKFFPEISHFPYSKFITTEWEKLLAKRCN